MSDESSADLSAYEWRPCSVVVPQFGLFVSRYGVKRRLMMPGRYLVRRSRSLRKNIYRAESG